MFRNKNVNSAAKVAFFTAFALLGSPSGSAAQPVKDVANLEVGLTKCAELDSNLHRLECYDGLAERLIQVSPRAAAPLLKESTETARAAAVKAEPAPVESSIEIESRREVARGKGRKLRPRLVAECGVSPKAWVVPGVILPAGTVPVNTRIDTGEVVKETWSVGSDKGRVVVPKPAQFLASLKRGKILEVKVSPKNGPPIPFSFDLTTLAAKCR